MGGVTSKVEPGDISKREAAQYVGWAEVHGRGFPGSFHARLVLAALEASTEELEALRGSFPNVVGAVEAYHENGLEGTARFAGPAMLGSMRYVMTAERYREMLLQFQRDGYPSAVHIFSQAAVTKWVERMECDGELVAIEWVGDEHERAVLFVRVDLDPAPGWIGNSVRPESRVDAVPISGRQMPPRFLHGWGEWQFDLGDTAGFRPMDNKKGCLA